MMRTPWLRAVPVLGIALLLGGLSAAAQPCTAPRFVDRGELLGLLPGPLGPVATRAVELNGDGLPDLLRSDSSGIAVSINLGGGRFAPSRNVFPVAPGVDGMAIGDFNGDGHPDLVVTDTREQTIRLLAGDGAGGFTDTGSFGFFGSFTALTPGDFDGDGHLDVAWVWLVPPDGRIAVAFGDGHGNFPRITSWAPPPDPLYSQFSLYTAHGSHAFDFDGDGKDDIAMASGSLSADISLVRSRGDGTFDDPRLLEGAFRSFSAGMAVADINGDGISDLFVLTTYENLFWRVCPILRLPAGGTSGPDFGACDSFPFSPLAFADLTGGGRADVAYSHGGALYAATGDGKGHFQPPVSWPSSTSSEDILVMDVDGDGRPDIVLGPKPGESARWWSNDCPFGRSHRPASPGPENAAKPHLRASRP